MNVLKPSAPKHTDGVLRVYCPKRFSTVVKDTAAVEAERQDAATWLGGVYAGPIAYCHPPVDFDKPTLASVTELVNHPCDLILVGDMGDWSRNPILLWRFVYACVDNDVRLIVWRDGVDTANDDWEVPLHLAVLRSGILLNTERRRKEVAPPKS